MTNISYKSELYPDCPIRNVLSRIGGKWSLLVLYTLNQTPIMRFRDIQKEIPDISQKMLASTLKMLEEDGLISRKLYAEVPPRVEYSLTERAHTLLPYIDQLIEWAKNNLTDILKDRMSRM